MKKIKSTVTYRVPHWNFCNVDRVDITGRTSKNTCRFCTKTRNGMHCMLYDEPLAGDGEHINKLEACCRATAGYPSDIDTDEAPTIPPRELMKQTLDFYTKTVNKLVRQGLPRQIAENLARQDILGG